MSRGTDGTAATSITVEAGAFAKALAAVAGAVERRNTIPILSNLLIESTSGTVRLVGTNLDMEVKIALAPSQFDGDMAITVAAQRLQQIASAMISGAQMKLTLDPDMPGRMIVSGGRSRFVLPTLPSQDFPRIAGKFDDGESARFTISAADLYNIFTRVGSAQSTQESRYYLNGIFIHADRAGAKRIHFAATDGNRLTHEILNMGDMPDNLPDTILPTRLISQLLQMLGSGEAGDLSVQVNGRHSQWRIGDFQVISKNIDGQFPDYTRVIPTANEAHITLDCDAMRAAVKRAGLILDERGGPVRLEFSDDKALLTAISAANGESSEEVPVDYRGEPISINFNAKYISDMLGQIPGGTAKLSLADSGAPALLTPIAQGEGHEFAGVVMPVRAR